MKRIIVLSILSLLISIIVSATAKPRYTVLWELYSDLSNYHSDTLPYTLDSTLYDESGWLTPDGWRTSDNIRKAYVVDWQSQTIQHWSINRGRNFVLIWDNWERGADGHPHPIAAYWVIPIE